MPEQTPPRLSLAFIDDHAAAVKNSADSIAIRPLIDSLFNSSLFSTAPTSFRVRLLNAEVNSRTHQVAITNAAIVSAMNLFAAKVSVPNYFGAISDQVVTIRLSLIRHFPNLLQVTNGAAQPDFQGVSPIGAFFLTDLLLRQKLYNPRYQVTPDQWLPLSSHALPTEPGSRLVVGTPAPPEITAFVARLRAKLPRIASWPKRALKVMFDTIGF